MINRNMLTAVGLGAALTAAAALLAAPGNAPDGATPGKRGEGRGHAKHAAAKIGEPAPAFALTGIDGKQYKLSDYAGKVVVLEWFNPECPVVVGQHTQGVLKDYANTTSKAGKAVWLAVNSGAPGLQGAGKEKSLDGQKRFGIQYPILLDESGEVGHAYGATNTPHMFVISKDGTLAYAGAIDNVGADGKLGDGETLINYVDNALTQLANGETVSPSHVKAYGCGVKYGKKAKENEG